MAIEITEFADVNISVSPTGVSGGNFGILGFLTNDTDLATNAIGTAERARSYTSLASVAADWSASSEVYLAAIAFYGQTPTPRDFTVLMAFETDQPALLNGGGSDTLAELVAASWNGAGVVTITVDGVESAVTDLDLSGAATEAAVAAALETAINLAGATCTVEAGAYGYKVFGVTTGATGTITAATGDAAEALGLLAHQAKAADGLDAETPVAALAAADTQGIEFVGLVTNKAYRDVLAGAVGTTTLEIASWANAADKIFCNTTNDLSVLNSALSTDVASLIKSASLPTLTSFSKNPSLYPSASVFGRAASVNFEAIGTTITLNLKQMPGITAEDLTPAEFAVLRSKYASAVVKIGKSTNAYTDSRLGSGSWLDTKHGLLWLENRMETDLFNLLYVSNTKIPFTQTGINTAVGVVEGSLRAAVRNGLCAPGYLADGTYLPEGFRVDSVALADVPVGDLGSRTYRGISFVMKGAGALHELEVAGSFTE